MGTAYTPALQVTASARIRRTRRLPLKGEVLVASGDAVQPESVVARAHIPGVLRTVRAAERLGIDSEELPAAARVGQGDVVSTGDLLGESRSFFGLFRSEVRAPVAGTVELVNPVTGHLSIREAPLPVEVGAYLEGRVTEVMEAEGVVVETRGALIQGIFGVGGERRGDIRVAVSAPDRELSAADISGEMRGQVLVGGARVTGEALERAAEVGAAGIVTGAVRDEDLVGYLGYDIGVAITGSEDVPFTLILTEGFGEIPMAARTFALLRSLEGSAASINGATQIRAGVIRPEVIIPHSTGSEQETAESHELAVGTQVRLIRDPHFGSLAVVTQLPPDPQRIPTGALVRVLEAELPDGSRLVVPRANVEIVQG